MPTPGYVFRDGGATPPVEETANNFEFRQRITKAVKSNQPPKTPEHKKPVTARGSAPLAQNTSTSHQLAVDQHEIHGAVQKAGQENRITNLGWQANAVGVDNLVGGLPNDELWTLVRRFNKQMYHVRAIPEAPPGGLDLNIADEDDFSPDKLRATIERLYMTVIVGLISFGKHVARLRSWREPARTAAVAGVYTLAWLLNIVMPAILLTVIVLITVPQSRDILFPPVPLALVDRHTGGIQNPPAGVLGSHDSVTGAPEKYKGEAVEQEASNLVSGIASVTLSAAAGRHEAASGSEGSQSKALDSSLPDPTKMANVAGDAQASAKAGGSAEVSHDKTKEPMEQALWAKMRPAMHAIGDVADGWERLANALSPTPPFDENKRLQLAAIFAPMFLLSLFVKPQWVARGNSLFCGLAFFSDPLIERGIAILNEKIPDWPKYLEIRNTLLKGVPTNAQLTITLLRIGEANRAPIPPPPSSSEPPPDEPAEVDKEALIEERGLDASQSEIEDAITVDQPSGTEEGEDSPTQRKKRGFGQKLVSAFKHTTASAVETKLTTDAGRAALGSKHAKDRLGILPSKKELRRKATEGPVEFKGRCAGRKGAVYVDSSVSPATSDGKRPASPCVYFTTELDQDEIVESATTQPMWAVSINDIAEVKKLGGLGWKGKIIVGWATSREVKDGIEIITRAGQVYRATALKEREELFNRVISMGSQVWESF